MTRVHTAPRMSVKYGTLTESNRFERSWPRRIRQRRIVQELLIRQALEKGDQIFLFTSREDEPLNVVGFVRIIVAVSGVRTDGDGPPSRSIVLDDVFQRVDASVMHIGSGDGDVAQCGNSKLADVLRLPRKPIQPRVGFWIRIAAA